MKVKRPGKTRTTCISLTQVDLDKANYIINDMNNPEIDTLSGLIRLLIRREYMRRETMKR